MNMNDCRDCRSVSERMTRYVDGSLSADECAAVEQHLQSCPGCRDCAGEESAARTVLRQCAARLKGESMPPELRSRCEALCRGRSLWQRVRAWFSLD